MNKCVVQSEATEDAERRAAAERQMEQSSGTLRSGAGAEQTAHSGARREVLDGAKRRTAPVVSTSRRPDNGDDGRLGRRGYCVGVGRGGAPGMMTIASDGGGAEKRLWL